jgi:iron(III) transport system substrate-binding protein
VAARGGTRLALALGLLLSAACSGGLLGGDEALTVYSGRDEEVVGPLLEGFTEDEGIELEVRYGDSAVLEAQLLEEGDKSPADVFFSEEAGPLGEVAAAGLLEPLEGAPFERVSRRFRSQEGLWVGTSARARVAVYDRRGLSEEDLPYSVEELTDEVWRGRLGLAPGDPSFQEFVAALIDVRGTEAARAWLEGLRGNEPLLFEDDSEVVRATAEGAVDVGLVDHQEFYRFLAEDGELPLAIHFFSRDPGSLIDATGVGILATTDQAAAAAALVDYLTGEEGQRFIRNKTFEYTVVRWIRPNQELVRLFRIQPLDVDLSELGPRRPQAFHLLVETGFL